MQRPGNGHLELGSARLGSARFECYRDVNRGEGAPREDRLLEFPADETGIVEAPGAFARWETKRSGTPRNATERHSGRVVVDTNHRY